MSYLNIQFRRHTVQQWTALNPVLPPGELGIEALEILPGGGLVFPVDQESGLFQARFKIGDGASAWNDLAYKANFNVLVEHVGLFGEDDETLLSVQLRQKSANDWLVADDILNAGEIGVEAVEAKPGGGLIYETDPGTGRAWGLFKIGDGHSTWNALGYAGRLNLLSDDDGQPIDPGDEFPRLAKEATEAAAAAAEAAKTALELAALAEAAAALAQASGSYNRRQAWTLGADIASGGILSLPDVYYLGCNVLSLYYEGVLCSPRGDLVEDSAQYQYEEIGDGQNATSNQVRLFFAARAGDVFDLRVEHSGLSGDLAAHDRDPGAHADLAAASRHITLSAALAAGANFTVPAYKVGSGRLKIYYDGVYCRAGADNTYQYKEIGTVGAMSATIQFYDLLPAGTQISAIVG
jgi:hypothetical protein